MKTMHKLELLAMALVAGVLFSTSPASATKPAGDQKIQLVNVGDEPLATGQISYGQPVLESSTRYPPLYSYWVTVKCQRLTPGATYSTPVGTFTASKQGKVSAAGRRIISWDAGGWGYVMAVNRLNPDGSWTTVLGW